MIKNTQQNASHLIVKAKPVDWDEWHGYAKIVRYYMKDIIIERKSIADELERIVSRLHTTDSEPLLRKMIKELRE